MPGNQRDVLPWLQAMDVFVLPSYANEGVPQALLQAMLCKLPIITTPVGSILDAIQDGENGLIVEPKNAEALHQVLDRLLREPALRLALAEHARIVGLEKFGLQAMLDKMEAIFHNATHV